MEILTDISRSQYQTVNILGVKVYGLTSDQLIAQVIDWTQQSQRKSITYLNAHCLNVACNDEEYLQILNRMDLAYPDGIGVVMAARFLHGQRFHKVTGRDWIHKFSELASRNGIRCYILGGKPGVAQKACQILKGLYPRLQLIGHCDGYFVEKDEVHVLREIEVMKPDVTFVGMGIPDQEKWIDRQREYIPSSVCWGVGALFDYVAGVELPVPNWMNHLALEWLWRLLIDPGGKWKRYLLGNPIFAFRVFRQKFIASQI